MGDAVLLLVVSRLLQHQLLRALVFKRRVVAAVALEVLVLQMQGDRGHRIQKFAVVADDQDSALESLQPALQPHQRIQVQVIGGLIEQQQVSWAHQGASQLQTHAPAARKTVDGLLQFMRRETQAQQQRLSP